MTDQDAAYRGYGLPLTPAHFRALREGAGLSQADVAGWAKVADRSVRRWDVTHRAPDQVARFVIDRWHAVSEAAAEVVEASQGDRVLLQPRGTDEGRAIMRLAMYELEQAGKQVRVSE